MLMWDSAWWSPDQSQLHQQAFVTHPLGPTASRAIPWAFLAQMYTLTCSQLSVTCFSSLSKEQKGVDR